MNFNFWSPLVCSRFTYLMLVGNGIFLLLMIVMIILAQIINSCIFGEKPQQKIFYSVKIRSVTTVQMLKFVLVQKFRQKVILDEKLHVHLETEVIKQQC